MFCFVFVFMITYHKKPTCRLFNVTGEEDAGESCLVNSGYILVEVFGQFFPFFGKNCSPVMFSSFT